MNEPGNQIQHIQRETKFQNDPRFWLIVAPIALLQCALVSMFGDGYNIFFDPIVDGPYYPYSSMACSTMLIFQLILLIASVALYKKKRSFAFGLLASMLVGFFISFCAVFRHYAGSL